MTSPWTEPDLTVKQLITILTALPVEQQDFTVQCTAEGGCTTVGVHGIQKVYTSHKIIELYGE